MTHARPRLRVGTSGYSYKAWIGRFYPEGTAADAMLQSYAERLSAVEINQTFYRLPRRELLERWASQVPEDFRFAIKASRRITHQKRLAGAQDELAFLLESCAGLGARLGVLLFQLPPYLRLDHDRLRRFLDELPEGTPAAFEFRHGSWDTEAVHQTLRERDIALVHTDAEGPETALISTARSGYLRMRRPDYSDSALASWHARVLEQEWSDAWIFFKHEDEARGPHLALRFLGAEPAS